MANLVSFQWHASSYDMIGPTGEGDTEDLFSGLASCHKLKVLDICEHRTSLIWTGRLFDLSNLTLLIYETSDTFVMPPDCSRLGVMLRERCPHLRVCAAPDAHRSPSTPPNIDLPILSGRWTDLESLP
ncbi:hypothetical protein BV25DRAFT_1823173 [Artomyces pyxidatus]|uniref:Uncharacterized protein n=1 Tax=Artomyces pyxidatus TaxID=48021 RepID=A0ACB8T667_9AGAM|nr:hypothetical protein BV25DRAFT_1823173 [Artomyces pyxidatus]